MSWATRIVASAGRELIIERIDCYAPDCKKPVVAIEAYWDNFHTYCQQHADELIAAGARDER